MRVSNLKLGIGIPNNFPMVPSAFFDSFICMEKPDFVFLRSSFGPIEEMRNNIVRDALLQGCTHLILMDTDQVYPVDTITRLLSHRLPVVGCLLFRRYPPFDPLMLTGEVTKYSTVTEWKDGELVEVDATGTGCVLYDTEVFTRIPDPWFRFRKTVEGGEIGEDIGFCHDIRKAGFKIYVDTGIKVGHLTKMTVDQATWELYKLSQEVAKRKLTAAPREDKVPNHSHGVEYATVKEELPYEAEISTERRMAGDY